MADTVLLITEDRSIAQKVRDACRGLEASLTHLSTLKDAAEELAATPPDLILCDYPHLRWCEDSSRAPASRCAVLGSFAAEPKGFAYQPSVLVM